ncbi:MAG TPA: prepilin-type N-terminal cleavage/methylation domain-containing protein [Sideroxyarcus sp.]|nr:prepilin-type N-terminal cleavage/methylation domain-containing protein [Sideroxyarcus sp.]
MSTRAKLCPAGMGGTSQRGFTMIELIMVIVILGVISVVVLPRFFDSNTFEARGAADQVRSALRYAQKVAIAQHRNITVSISSGANPDCGTALAGAVLTCVVSDHVAVPAKSVTFNALGQPVPNAADSIVIGGTTISIQAETGYVQ